MKILDRNSLFWGTTCRTDMNEGSSCSKTMQRFILTQTQSQERSLERPD